jgi:hypothetical protein
MFTVGASCCNLRSQVEEKKKIVNQNYQKKKKKKKKIRGKILNYYSILRKTLGLWGPSPSSLVVASPYTCLQKTIVLL